MGLCKFVLFVLGYFGGGATFPFSFPPARVADEVGFEESEGEDPALWGTLVLQFFCPSGGLAPFFFEVAEEADGLLDNDREDSDFWGLWGF